MNLTVFRLIYSTSERKWLWYIMNYFHRIDLCWMMRYTKTVRMDVMVKNRTQNLLNKSKKLYFLGQLNRWKTCYLLNRSEQGKVPRYRPGCGPEGGKGIALLFQDLDARRVWVVSSTPRPRFTPGKNLYPLYRWLGWPQGQSELAENLASTGIRPPAHTRSESWRNDMIHRFWR
jgi:hypothetical protein